jgi:hypothetical protein
MFLIVFFTFVSSENAETSVIKVFNDVYSFISGSSKIFYTSYYVVESSSTDNNGFSLVLLTNSSILSSMGIHYIQGTHLNNTFNLISNINPAYTPLNYTETDLKDIFSITLQEKYSQLNIFSTKQQLLHINNSITYSLLEIIYAGDGNSYRSYYIIKDNTIIGSYNWITSNNLILKEESTSKYLILLVFFISCGITAVLVYFYWHFKHKFPFFKIQDDKEGGNIELN